MSKIMFAGTGEKLQYLLHEHNDNTIRFVLRYPGLIDPDLMCAAVKALILKSDILHSSFHNDALNAHWIIQEEYDDSCFFQYIRTEGDPYVTAQSLALLPVLPEGPAQLRCYLVQNEKQSAVALTISHLCVDGGDGKYLLSKLAESYGMLAETGCADELTIKNGSRAPEQIYEGLKLKEILSLLKIQDNGVKSEFPFADQNLGRWNMVYMTIPADVMAAARRRAKAAGATVNDLLLTALYEAYAAMPGVDADAPMSVMSMIDLRRHCSDGESEGLGNMSGTFPTKLMEGIGEDFSATLCQVAEQTRQMKENPLAGMDSLPLIHGVVRTMPMKLLTLVAGKVYGSFSLGLTNLGSIDNIALGNLVPTEGLFGGPLKKKPGMQVSAASFDGTCSLCVVGQYTDADTVLLRTLLDKMANQIVAYANGI